MAKNWKKAHDAVTAQTVALNAKLQNIAVVSHDQGLTIDRLREQLRATESNLSLACNHMRAAADQLLTRNAVSTAELLSREAERLYPFKAMGVNGAKEERR